MLSDFRRAKFMIIFNNLDNNQDGVLAADDYQRIAARIADVRGFGADSPERQELARRYNGLWSYMVEIIQPADAHITMDEWLGFHGEQSAERGRAEAFATNFAETVFDMLGITDESALTLNRYEEYLTARGFTTDLAATVFNHYDANADGLLTKDEVRALVFDFYISDDPADVANYALGRG